MTDPIIKPFIPERHKSVCELLKLYIIEAQPVLTEKQITEKVATLFEKLRHGVWSYEIGKSTISTLNLEPVNSSKFRDDLKSIKKRITPISLAFPRNEELSSELQKLNRCINFVDTLIHQEIRGKNIKIKRGPKVLYGRDTLFEIVTQVFEEVTQSDLSEGRSQGKKKFKELTPKFRSLFLEVMNYPHTEEGYKHLSKRGVTAESLERDCLKYLQKRAATKNPLMI